jgi:hypothetical protein
MRQTRWIAWGCLLLVLLVGWYVRFEDLDEWEKQPQLFSYEGQPLLLNLDGHLYLRWARELIDGAYTPVDELRAFPDEPARPSSSPLLSVLTSVAQRLSFAPLNRVALLLPALLGPLFALPLWRTARLLGGGPVMAGVTALSGVLSVQYVSRSRAGWFDTDCLVLTFSMAAVALFMGFALESGRRRYLQCAGGIAIYWLFLWWWDTTPAVVSVIALTPLAIALLFYYRSAAKQSLILGGALAASAVVLLVWQGFDFPSRVMRGLLRTSRFLSADDGGPFPATGGSIDELLAPGWSEVVGNTTGSSLLFVAGLAGLGWLAWSARKHALFLALPVLLALSTFLLGARFTIFVAPVTALGLGFLVERIWTLGRKRYPRWMPLALAVMVALTAWPAFSAATRDHTVPAYIDRLAAIDAAAKLTPADAVVWTTWELGYPLMHYASRRTVADGIYLEGERLAYVYRPLATDDPRRAANLIRFHVARGMEGMLRLHDAAGGPVEGMRLIGSLMAAGPEDSRPLLEQRFGAGEVDGWVEFLFPRDAPPVYLLLHRRMAQALDWYDYGTWDLERGSGTRAVYKPYLQVQERAGRIVGSDNLDLDALRGGALRVRDDRGNEVRSTLAGIAVHTGERFEWIRPTGYGALMTRDIAGSTFNRLFVRHESGGWFRPVALRTPSFQLWEVVGG